MLLYDRRSSQLVMLNVVVIVIVMGFPTSHSAIHEVHLPPTITEQAESQITYHKNGKVELACAARGMPNLNYSWKKNGDFLLPSSNVHLSQERGDLNMTSMSEDDEGFYQCFARNDYGSSLSGVTHLRMARNAEMTEEVARLEGTLGSPLTIPCRRNTDSYPRAEFSWWTSDGTVDKFPKLILTNKRIQITQEGDLYITNLLAEDDQRGRLYKCNIMNVFLDMVRGGSYTQVTVSRQGPVEETPPTQLYPLSDEIRIALVGEKLALKCLFAANPTPTVKWSKENGQFDPRRHQNKEHSTELIINEIEMEDEGVYVCRGRNAPSEQEMFSDDVKIVVDVQAKPVFPTRDSKPHNTNVTEGEDVTFYCKTAAEPPASVQWLINGIPLDLEGPGPRRSVAHDDTALTFKSTQKSDLLVVQCNASNQHGYVFSSGYLNVLLSTKLTEVPTDVLIDTDSTAVRFNCSATSDDSTPITLTWWKDGDMLLLPSEDLRMILEESGDLVIDLDGLDFDEVKRIYVGVYECVADNEYTPAAKASATLGVLDMVKPDAVLKGAKVYKWWMFVIVAVVVILIIATLGCFIYRRRKKANASDSRETHNQTANGLPLVSIDHDVPHDTAGSRDIRILHDSYNGEDDTDSMEEYCDDEMNKFDEDGSFRGRYHDENVTLSQ